MNEGCIMSTSKQYRLSPYCVMHSDATGRHLILHHALHGSRFEVPASLLPVLAQIHGGADVDALLATQSDPIRTALEMLMAEQVLDSSAHDSAAFENRLTPVELCVQRGFNEGGYLPDALRLEQAPPVAKTYDGSPTIGLRRHGTSDCSVDLLRCLDARRSIRTFGDAALEPGDFERFLQYSCSAQHSMDAATSGPVALRPYPSAGALHPLEIYPLLFRHGAIDQGLYHYNPIHHHLTALKFDPQHGVALLDHALQRLRPAGRGVPAALIIITARVDRTCWKYTGMAYQSMLMETGALYQTMYLVATALNLALCAIGAFPERATAEILGLDSTQECQVGLLALGTR